MTWLFLFITVTCAFCVGYASRRGSVCAVLAARMMVIDGKSSRFRAMGVAAAGSGAGSKIRIGRAVPEDKP